jgi:hypothetical protein
MRLSSTTLYRCALLVLVALIAARLSDAHLHFCLDGQEAPVALHMADGALHNDAHHVDDEHADRDVDLLESAFAKKTGSDAKVFVLALICVLLLSAVTRSERIPISQRWVPFFDPLRLRPPLRGPPS